MTMHTLVGKHPNLQLKFLTSYSRTALGPMVLVRKLNCSISEGTLIPFQGQLSKLAQLISKLVN